MRDDAILFKGSVLYLIGYRLFYFFRHKGVVSDVIEGTSILSVDLDDGRAKTLDLGKQGIRFVPQKQKRLKS